jgi:Fur family transcriptional regulator, peroxide stress response regulator
MCIVRASDVRGGVARRLGVARQLGKELLRELNASGKTRSLRLAASAAKIGAPCARGAASDLARSAIRDSSCFLLAVSSQLGIMRTTDPGRRERRLEHLSSVVREAGIKLTHQRLEIFRELAATEEHPDAETLFRAVQHRMPTVSLDTVYRTLWMLRDLGLVTTLGPSRDGVRFDVNLELHHHYVCVRCASVRDFDSEELNGLRLPDDVKALGSIVQAQVEVRGLCASCLRETAKTKTAKTKTAKTTKTTAATKTNTLRARPAAPRPSSSSQATTPRRTR